ncbi:hypothetical protein PHAVU_007G221600 [Phaseolus vulgaris]|uniref:Uncharacterized protein n=1 Tax=Phaseolus vulgaris TaxID=3885 RepID=V7BH49_PHAVU|nr:hypothetical protein PHAVU_007G221600g [Phaseolus vulgaris]ESW17224.1 hypothetical protein PHAVU_007G221600g [Phaseolus vulgaris]
MDVRYTFTLWVLGFLFGFSKHKPGQQCFSLFWCPTTDLVTQSRTQESTSSQPSLSGSTPSQPSLRESTPSLSNQNKGLRTSQLQNSDQTRRLILVCELTREFDNHVLNLIMQTRD